MPSDTHEPSFAAFVAIDWADRKHVFALQDAAGSGRERGEIQHTPEAVESWVASLLLRFELGPREIAAVLAGVLPLGLFSSAVQMWVATFARSYKEAQTYVSFLMFFPMLPAFFFSLPSSRRPG